MKVLITIIFVLNMFVAEMRQHTGERGPGGGGEGREGGTGFAKGSLKINKSTEKGLFIVELF